MTVLVPERTTQRIQYSFQDQGAPAAPTSGRYRIDCLTTGRQVRAWTSISGVAASGVITLTTSDTAIIDRANGTERKLVQVEGTYGVADAARNRTEITVERMEGVA